jgi:pimeloyl-ACP methyl ester carboxylesterase
MRSWSACPPLLRDPNSRAFRVRLHLFLDAIARECMKIFFVVALALLALAAAGHEARSTPRFEAAPCPKTPEPISALRNARCGFLVVPENRSRPDGRMLRLAVAIVSSQVKPAQPDPIVFLAGGPGEAAILDTPFLVEAGINRNRDVIIVDQRGTLYDDPDLNCPELDRYYAQQVSLVYDAPSTGRVQAAAAAACHQRLVNQGIDLSSFNTTENEKDIGDLRRVLGIRQWNVYGYSYGTDLALSMMRDHPDGIRSVIIDSIVPPDIVGLPWTWGSAKEGMTTIFGDCEAQPKCARAYPNLLETFTRDIIRLEKHPLVRNVDPPHGRPAVKVVLDGGTILNMIAANLPKPADMPRAIVNLAHGNPTKFFETRVRAASVADVPEQAQGMTQSFVCREWEPYGPPAEILRAGRKAFPTLPSSVLINAVQMPFEHELCQVWNVPPGPASQRVRVRSAIPTLVVSGAIDGKTGAKWGRYVAGDLPNSTYVRINAVGHWVIVQSPCAQKIFQSFLLRPRSPNTACAATVPGVSFNL